MAALGICDTKHIAGIFKLTGQLFDFRVVSVLKINEHKSTYRAYHLIHQPALFPKYRFSAYCPILAISTAPAAPA